MRSNLHRQARRQFVHGVSSCYAYTVRFGSIRVFMIRVFFFSFSFIVLFSQYSRGLFSVRVCVLLALRNYIRRTRWHMPQGVRKGQDRTGREGERGRPPAFCDAHIWQGGGEAAAAAVVAAAGGGASNTGSLFLVCRTYSGAFSYA